MKERAADQHREDTMLLRRTLPTVVGMFVLRARPISLAAAKENRWCGLDVDG